MKGEAAPAHGMSVAIVCGQVQDTVKGRQLMHAVLVEVDTSGQPDREVGLKSLREELVPRISQVPGFQAGYWLRPLEDAKGTSLVLFDTRENAEAASRELSVGSSVGPGVTVVRKELREVAASA